MPRVQQSHYQCDDCLTAAQAKRLFRQPNWWQIFVAALKLVDPEVNAMISGSNLSGSCPKPTVRQNDPDKANNLGVLPPHVAGARSRSGV
jgi:hypothetical protein